MQTERDGDVSHFFASINGDPLNNRIILNIDNAEHAAIKIACTSGLNVQPGEILTLQHRATGKITTWKFAAARWGGVTVKRARNA